MERVQIISDDVISDVTTPSFSRNVSSSGFGSSRTESERYSARQDTYFNSLTADNPYKGTPYEVRYNYILSHYQMLIEQARSNEKWYEDIGLSRYTEKLISQYTADMYAELRDLEAIYRDYLTTLPENVVELQSRAGLNSDLLGLQYNGASGGSSSSGLSRSSVLPSNDPASDALNMGLSMIGSITDFATGKLPSLIASIGAIRGVSLDNDLKKQQLQLGQFNQYAQENEYLREFALNTFGSYGFSDDKDQTSLENSFMADFLNMSMSQMRELSDLPQFLDDNRALSYLRSYVNSENFESDKHALRNGTLKLSRDNSFLSETYGSDFTAMTEFYRSIGPLVRDLELLTARFNLNQASYDFNTVSDDVTSIIGSDGSLSFVDEVSSALDPESATKAVNAGNDRSYYQNQFESDVKEVMQKHTKKWSEKADSGEWWSWIYDLLIMALPQFIQGLSSGSISLFRGGNTSTYNSHYVDNTTSYDYGNDIVSNRYFNGSAE